MKLRQGVYTTQTVYEARKLCRDAIFVKRDHSLYSEYSAKIMEFLRLVGPTEVASIDEAYIDVTERVQEGLHPVVIARYIQKTLWEKIHIPCSIGIGPTTIIAKQASEVKKPMGIVQLGPRQYQTYFYPRPLSDLYGCGRLTEDKLNKQGIHTIGDLAKADLSTLKILLGQRGELLHDYAHGISRNTVNPLRGILDKSIGKETTFREDTSDTSVIF